MTLVSGISDYGWLIEHWGTLFPAAPEPELPSGSGLTHAQRFLQFLRDALAAGKREATNREIASALGLVWKVVKKDVLPRIEDLIEELGWRYTPAKGRAPGVYHGVRGLFVTCHHRGHERAVNMDDWPDYDDATVPSFGPRMRCSRWGKLGATAVPNWIEQADRLPGGSRR
jgi:hypothetical protein